MGEYYFTLSRLREGRLNEHLTRFACVVHGASMQLSFSFPGNSGSDPADPVRPGSNPAASRPASIVGFLEASARLTARASQPSPRRSCEGLSLKKQKKKEADGCYRSRLVSEASALRILLGRSLRRGLLPGSSAARV